MRSFNKLSADRVLCARSAVRSSRWFFRQNIFLCSYNWHRPRSYKSKVWKDFGFKVFYDGHHNEISKFQIGCLSC